jgi:excisionase family DNA binding protein
MVVSSEFEPRPAHRVRELARALNVHPVSVYRRIWAGEIEVVRFGGVVRIPDREFRRLTASSETHAAREVV